MQRSSEPHVDSQRAGYALLTGAVSGFVLVQAVVFGAGPMIFGLYSNTNYLLLGSDSRAGLSPEQEEQFASDKQIGGFAMESSRKS